MFWICGAQANYSPGPTLEWGEEPVLPLASVGAAWGAQCLSKAGGTEHTPHTSTDVSLWITAFSPAKPQEASPRAWLNEPPQTDRQLSKTHPWALRAFAHAGAPLCADKHRQGPAGARGLSTLPAEPAAMGKGRENKNDVSCDLSY